MVFSNAIYNLERKCKTTDGLKLRNAKRIDRDINSDDGNKLFLKLSPFK